MTPTTSIIIPVYNAEKWLPRCLNSILQQTEKNFEVLCVNDASYDKSHELLLGYASQDSRIKVLSLERNMGAGAARNKGLEAAQGKYICFVDADDTLPIDSLELRIKILQKYNSEAVRGARRIYYSDFEKIVSPCSGILTNICPSKECDDVFFHFIEGHTAFLFLRDFVEAHKARNEQTFRNNEDVIFLLKLFFKYKNVSLFDKVVYNYIKENKVSATSLPWDIKKFKSLLASSEIFYDLASNNNKIRYADSRFVFLLPWIISKLSESLNKNFINFEEVCDILKCIKKIIDKYSIFDKLFYEKGNIIYKNIITPSCLFLILLLKQNNIYIASQLIFKLQIQQEKNTNIKDIKRPLEIIVAADRYIFLWEELLAMQSSYSWRITFLVRAIKLILQRISKYFNKIH